MRLLVVVTPPEDDPCAAPFERGDGSIVHCAIGRGEHESWQTSEGWPMLMHHFVPPREVTAGDVALAVSGGVRVSTVGPGMSTAGIDGSVILAALLAEEPR